MNITLFTAICSFFIILILAQCMVYVVRKRHPDKDWTELTQRMQTWWLIVLVFVLAISTPQVVSLIIFGFISFLALKEFFTMIPTRYSDNTPLLWAYVSIPIQYYFVGAEWFGMFIVFIPVYVFLFLPTVMVLIGDTKGFLHSAATLHWGVMTTVFAISHVAFLNVLGDDKSTGALMVIYLVALTECNDIAQYLWGKTLGKRKIIPKVSPNKTVEGLLGGIATTMVLALILGPILTPMTFSPLGLLHCLLAGLLIGVFGFIGDVVMSAVKRDIGVKDSGKLLPGHGGILDRLDSLIYTAPIFFHFIYYYYF
ncbi:phosphatidate cytidylyltransferase [Neisseria sp. Ec49-e6-T10]|uniref:phosphatidate cytidylyltransferase n=1 Tax=Neisseria sp. Ec49-e6-T10 TaxID=3140744 RepID=UPI003EB731AC